jgi:hypothetical protein
VPAPPIAEIVWAATLDPATNAPIETVDQYASDAARIVAVAYVDNLAAGSSVEASWEYNNTSLDAFTTRLMTTERIDDRWVDFHLERDASVPWPEGTYEIAVAIDGSVVQRASIDVVDSE